MRNWIGSVLTLGVIAIATTSAASADDLRADEGEGKALLREGDKLADKNETTEAVIRYKRAFEDLLPGMRKLSFKHEVKRDVTPRDGLREVLLKELDEEIPPAEFRANELGMKALGLIPGDLDLKEVMVKLYVEEIAAFYDPKTKTMHLIKEEAAKAQKAPSFLEKLLGKKGGFDKDENKTVIAHELTHALADQNFDLDKMHKAAKGDDDRDLALSALIEGEATLTMMGAQMSDWDGSKISKIPAADLDRIFSFMRPLMVRSGGVNLREAPPILVESMIFPYIRGMIFCARLTNDGGWDALNAAYGEPPLSTEQILHPEKYKASPDPPTSVDLGKLDAGKGWKELGRNVVGEMQLGVMLQKQGGKVAAAGWDGDTFAVFESADARLGIVWLSTWDVEEDAREFARAYARYQTAKLGKDATEPDAFPDAIRRPRSDAIFAVERRDKDVAVVEGFSSESTEPLIEAAFRSSKTEKTRSSSPKMKEAAAQ